MRCILPNTVSASAWLCLLLASVSVALLLTPTAVRAETYLVRSGGLRVNGPSTPGDWALSNCYPRVDLATAAAAAPDTVVLYDETHAVDTIVIPPALLTAQDDGEEATVCIVEMGPGGSIQPDPSLAVSTLAGLEIRGGSVMPAVWATGWSAESRDLVLRGCVFAGNGGTASPLAGGSCLTVDPSPSGGVVRLDVRDCRFEGNTSAGRGGAIYLAGNCDATFERCDFLQNTSVPPSVLGGGALALVAKNAPSSLTMRDCDVAGNGSRGAGGGLFVWNADVLLENCQIRDNQAAFDSTNIWTAGAGIEVAIVDSTGVDKQLILRNCLVSGNRGNFAQGNTAGDGGGVHGVGLGVDDRLMVEISDCEIADNFNSQGGGVYFSRYSEGVIQRTRFIGNSAGNGGAAFKGGGFAPSLGETLEFRYCLFQDNEALNKGGAFMVRHFPRGEFINCTFVDNVAAVVGDAIYNGSSQSGNPPYTEDGQRSTLTNCVFYGTVGNDVQVRADSLAFSQVTHCAYEAGQFAGPGIVPQSTVVLTESPFVSALDLRLAPGSPCIDSGLDQGSGLDLDGILVPMGGATDIGAYEFLDVVAVTPPARGLLQGRMHPNPLRGVGRLEWNLRTTAKVSATVYDARGRRIWHVPPARYEPGFHGLVWAGRDEQGRSVAAGTYFWSLEAAGLERVTGKFAVLRP